LPFVEPCEACEEYDEEAYPWEETEAAKDEDMETDECEAAKTLCAVGGDGDIEAAGGEGVDEHSGRSI
jgi:hypothetical protein